jgi:crotonobetainyl-CoA:carnitine CoA-transferase CaiB-like acyl-CoA transferase
MAGVEQVGSANSGPLSGVMVLDLTQHLAGPFATQILGDLGARIIKVEPPKGDSTRDIGPYFVDGLSAYFFSTNRNKESICIDLKMAEGKKLLLSLVEKADVVIENFRPGTMEKLGIGYDVLSNVNPKIIVCSITGFGQSGPYVHHPAFDIIVQALSGGMSLTGDTEGRPVRSGLPIGDVCAGMYGVIGVLAGLVRRSIEGRGAYYVDVAMLDTQVSLLSYVASYYLIGGIVPGLQGRGHMSIPTYRAFTCSDNRDVVVAANTEKMFESMCQALGLGEIASDPRFSDNRSRLEHRSELYQILEPRIAEITSGELIQMLTDADVPVAPINNVDEALTNSQVVHRNMVLEVPLGDHNVKVVGNPVKVPDERPDHLPPPRLGEHTVSVLKSVLGIDDNEIDGLIESGVVVAYSGELGQG